METMLYNKMKLDVSIDYNSGFCFGVVYAVQMAEDILKEEGHLYCLGDIVHNDEELGRLVRLGLEVIDHQQLTGIRNEKVLIRAHGEPPSTYELAINNNIELIDASCPVVLKLQNRIKSSYDKKEVILIYGKKDHAEVKGLLGQTNNNAIVFENIDELDMINLPENIYLYSQTTKSTKKFAEVGKRLLERGYNVKVNDTICRQVANRDVQLKEFAAKFDTIIFVAGQKSSNGKVLFDACLAANENTYFVTSPHDLKREWFTGNETVGIAGATSTPLWLMESVKEELMTY